MSLKLMYITNQPDVAVIAEAAGVDRIFVDMEYIGKSQRQGGMDTVQSRHTVADIAAVRKVLHSSELLVRCNPIHAATEEYGSSAEEIEKIVDAGADVIMLPYFKTADEVRTFVALVSGRAKTLLLLETPEAAEHIDEILAVEGIDEVHIGLNDLSLGYGMKFMFEPLANGMVDRLAEKLRDKGIPFGFGGIASLGKGMLPAERVICEHYRLGSTAAILSRSFCNVAMIQDIGQVRSIFTQGVHDIRAFERECMMHPEDREDNRRAVQAIVQQIVNGARI